MENENQEQIDIKDAILYLAFHALRAPITQAEAQKIASLRDQLIAAARGEQAAPEPQSPKEL